MITCKKSITKYSRMNIMLFTQQIDCFQISVYLQITRTGHLQLNVIFINTVFIVLSLFHQQ